MQETNQSLLNEMKCRTLRIEDRVSFLYTEGGRSIICGCLAAIVIEKQLTHQQIYRKIYMHHLNEHPENIFSNAEVRKSIHDFVEEIEPKINISKLRGVPCDILKELELEACPPGYKIDMIRWCLNCGSSLSKYSVGSRAKCCAVSSFCECPGLVTHQGDEGAKRKGTALVCGFPELASHLQLAMKKISAVHQSLNNSTVAPSIVLPLPSSNPDSMLISSSSSSSSVAPSPAILYPQQPHATTTTTSSSDSLPAMPLSSITSSS
jgi:hypothetical protein